MNCSPIVGHSGCFQVLVLWIKLLWTFHVQVLCEHFSTKCPALFPNGHTILHSHLQWIRDSVSLHPHQQLVLSLFFNLSYSDKYIVVSHYGFDLHFSLMVFNMFSYPHLPSFLTHPFSEIAVHVFCLFSTRSFLLLSIEHFLYILDTSLLLDVWFVNVFCQSIACLSSSSHRLSQSESFFYF